MTNQTPNYPDKLPDSGFPTALPSAAAVPSVSSQASVAGGETVAAKDSSSSSSLPHTPPTSPHAGRRISRKQLDTLRSSLSERDWNVIRMAGKFRFVTAKHLTLTLFQGHASDASAARTCRRVLARLRSQRVLGVMERRIGGLRAGSEGMVYYLDTAGERLHRQVTGSTIRQRFEEPSARFMDHTLAIADIAAQLHHEVTTRGGEIVSLAPEPRRTYTAAHGGTGRLVPDLAVELAGEPGADTISAFFVEVDLGHESLPTLINKCLAIEQYRASGEEQRQFGGFPRIIWAMNSTKPATTERRIAALARSIDEHPQLPQHLYTVMHLRDVPAAMLTEAKRS